MLMQSFIQNGTNCVAFVRNGMFFGPISVRFVHKGISNNIAPQHQPQYLDRPSWERFLQNPAPTNRRPIRYVTAPRRIVRWRRSQHPHPRQLVASPNFKIAAFYPKLSSEHTFRQDFSLTHHTC